MVVVITALFVVFGSQVFAMDPDVMAKKVLCHTCLMEIYIAQANVKEATTEFNELFKLTPNDAALHFKYANFLARNSKPDLAVPHFKLAAKLKPAVPEYQVGLGNTLMYAKDYSGAEAAYTKAIMLGGKSPEQLKQYQDLLQKAQQYEAQQKQYEQYEKKIQQQKESE